ncbi:hypothetical protein SeMB42_g03952 [Synchytrium endobioticum]|uniref:C2H2-type domain-containing protein n=1 Tax=Synchytrium endobioticum TaxID=286115 RepID=A0A507D2E7_9FUNG|nr:hypothetical protein SeMB42_g03952 [Synchytrium endobioticum]
MNALAVLADLAEYAANESTSTDQERANQLEQIYASDVTAGRPSITTESQTHQEPLDANGRDLQHVPIQPLLDPARQYRCKCVGCADAFTTQQELVDHLMSAHVNTIARGGYECPVCPDGAVFARQMGLRNHIFKEHVSLPRRVAGVYGTGGLNFGSSTSGFSPSPVLKPSSSNSLYIPSSNPTMQIPPSMKPLPPSMHGLPVDVRLDSTAVTPMTTYIHDEGGVPKQYLDDYAFDDDNESFVLSSLDSPVAPMRIAHQLLAVAQQRHAAELNNATGLMAEEHEPPEVFHCPKEDCTVTSDEFQALLKHMIYAHAEVDSDRPYVCPYPGCNKSYPGQGGIKYHILHVHADRTGVPVPEIACPRSGCRKVYTTAGGLVYHLEFGHQGPHPGAIVVDGPPFPCPAPGCSFSFLKVQATELHLWQKHNKRQILIATADDTGIEGDEEYDQERGGGELLGDLVKAAAVLASDEPSSVSATYHQTDDDEDGQSMSLDGEEPNTDNSGGTGTANSKRKRGRPSSHLSIDYTNFHGQ